MSPYNSLMLACGDVVLVAVVRNVVAADDVAAAVGVVVAVGAVATVDVWVQQCWDESMQKYVVSFGVSGGDTKGKEAIIVLSVNNPGPTFNNGEASMLSTMVLTAGLTFMCVVIPCGSMVLMVGIMLEGVVSPCRS